MSLLRRAKAIDCDHGLRRQTLVQSLLTDIFQGRLQTGQRLVAQELAERFGVSQTPIREALIELAGIGIIDLLPNRGAVVRRVTSRDVYEICHVRRVLECATTQTACKHIPLSELDELANALRVILKVSPTKLPDYIEKARELDSKLHDLIAASCPNTFLKNELGRLKILFRAFRDLSWSRDASHNDYRRLNEEATEHLEIVRALQKGDARLAARAMASHIRSGAKYWSRSLPGANGDGSTPKS